MRRATLDHFTFTFPPENTSVSPKRGLAQSSWFIRVACVLAVVAVALSSSSASAACDINTSTSQNYISDITGAGSYKTVCLAPGTYTGLLVLQYKDHLTLSAPSGGVSWTTDSATSGPIRIYQSSHVTIDGLYEI